MENKQREKIKCVIWDLDNTIWTGTLLEDEAVKLNEDVVTIIKALDSRGILQSVASKNESDLALAKLRQFGLEEYFLYPQINWNAKSLSVKKIVETLNIGMNTIAFIDDQPFEREEVSHTLSEVLCIDTADLSGILDLPEMNPPFITADSKLRRKMYMSDRDRNKDEADFVGPQEEFLASLQMVLTISEVTEDDLQRAEELTVRTHQLNTTGYTYSYEELYNFSKSKQHIVLIAGLEDKYGTYGKIGLTLIECQDDIWTIKLLLMSCRVMSRGVGTIIINHIMHLAKEAGVRLRAEFVQNDRNRMMYVTYKFAGFKDTGAENGITLLESDLTNIQMVPDYLTVNISDNN
jgi:FkbH-like protein